MGRSDIRSLRRHGDCRQFRQLIGLMRDSYIAHTFELIVREINSFTPYKARAYVQMNVTESAQSV
jgi:hypothetical protein